MAVNCNVAGDTRSWISSDGEVVANATGTAVLLTVSPSDSVHGRVYTCVGTVLSTGATSELALYFFAVSKYWHADYDTYVTH